ncbi:hypothetical protein [Actinacidiphila oryziradicis]|uniref:hypothetical protein n=1 Tax=Actinacidiphila oryziradicis TaxID=2571141 RepID=UPI0023F59589|nr:hypothetical protein [Actinacidiphila oryziradicis]MCW2873751.1 putative LuxR-family transcriptional regulator [Actinacidiphila oryziradicis]
MRFVQALVRDTIATGLSRLRRTRMHARLADALERLQPGGISPLAYHYSRAATAATAAKAARYCVQAAEYAEARYARDTAIELLTQAWSASAGSRSPSTPTGTANTSNRSAPCCAPGSEPARSPAGNASGQQP